MNKNKQIFILILLILILLAINYSWMDSFVVKSLENKKLIVVSRIIDGDTIVAGNETIRLLGVNTPERGEIYYAEAKSFLENLVVNKTIELEKIKEDVDKYNRSLRYAFLDNKNINLELVKNGLANPYFPSGKDRYSKEFYNEWKNCIIKNINLCEKSTDACANCIELEELNIEKQKTTLYNKCYFACDLNGWSIKGEGRKITSINESVNEKNQLTITTENVWTKTGDTLFLRDNENKLVLYYNY